jgi:hypothetical protein
VTPLDPTRRGAYAGPRFEVPAERPAAVRGLSERLAEKACEAIDRPRYFAPVFRPEFVSDRLKEAK